MASNLVKTAVHGSDPNWGRVAAALGRSGAEVDESKLALYVNDVCIFEYGLAVPFHKDSVVALMRGPEVSFRLNLGLGDGCADAWGCAISANTFTIVAQRALVIRPKSGRITVTGNNFSNAHIGGKVKRNDAATGILLQDTSDVAISGNVFTGLAQHAIKGTAVRLVVAGNVMADLPRSEPMTTPPNKKTPINTATAIDNGFTLILITLKATNTQAT